MPSYDESDQKIIFLIGPGGVGKSTTGKILADLIGYTFVDLDQEFCEKYGIIGKFIDDQGYSEYCYENSKLFYDILECIAENSVFALSSGFLVHEGFSFLISDHKRTIRKKGKSILLLPSESMDESCDIVVKRQLNRGFGLDAKKEKEKFIKRFPKYIKLGDIKIFSYETPEKIAEEMKNKYEKLLS